MAAFRLPYGAGPGPGPVCPYCARIHHPFCLPPLVNPNFPHRLYDPTPNAPKMHSSLPPYGGSTVDQGSFGGYGRIDLEAFEAAGPLLGSSFRPRYAAPFPRPAEGLYPANPSSHRPHFASPVRFQNHDLLHQASWHAPPCMGEPSEDKALIHDLTERVDRNPEGSSLNDFQGNVPAVLLGEHTRSTGQWMGEEDRFRVHSSASGTPQSFLDPQHRFASEFDRYAGADGVRAHRQHFLESAKQTSIGAFRETSLNIPHDPFNKSLTEDFGKYLGFERVDAVRFHDREVTLNHDGMDQGEMIHNDKHFYEERRRQDHSKEGSSFRKDLGNIEPLGEHWIDRKCNDLSETGEYKSFQNGARLHMFEKEGGLQRGQDTWYSSPLTARQPDAHGHTLEAGSVHSSLDGGELYGSNIKGTGLEMGFKDSFLAQVHSHQTRVPLYKTQAASSLERQQATRDSWGNFPAISSRVGRYNMDEWRLQVQEKDEVKQVLASRELELLREHGLLDEGPENMLYPTRSELKSVNWSERETTLLEEKHPFCQGGDVKRRGPAETLHVGTRVAEFQNHNSIPRTLSNTDRMQKGVLVMEQSQRFNEKLRSEQKTADFLPSSAEELNLLHVQKGSVIHQEMLDHASAIQFSRVESNPYIAPAAAILDVHSFSKQLPVLEDSRPHELASSLPPKQSGYQSKRFQEAFRTNDVNCEAKFHCKPSEKVDKVHLEAFEEQRHKDQQWNQRFLAHPQPYPESKSHASNPAQQVGHFLPPHLQLKESVAHLPFLSQLSDFPESCLPGQSASQERPNFSPRKQHQCSVEFKYLHTDPVEPLIYPSNEASIQRQDRHRQDVQAQSLKHEHLQMSPSELILSNQQQQKYDVQHRIHLQYLQKPTLDSMQRLHTGQQIHAFMQQKEPQSHQEAHDRSSLVNSKHQHQDMAQELQHPNLLAEGPSGQSSFLQHQRQIELPSLMTRVHPNMEGHYHAVSQSGSVHESFLSGLSDSAKPFTAAHAQQTLAPIKTQSPSALLHSGHIYPPLPPKIANSVVPPPPPSPPPAPPSPPPPPFSPPKLNDDTSHLGDGGMVSRLSSAPRPSHDVQDTSNILQYAHSQGSINQSAIQGSSFQMMNMHHVPFGPFSNHVQNPPSKITQKQETSKIVDAVNIFRKPGRAMRPERFVIILRGLPGSGKSHLAKALRDVEVMNDGNAPRIHSIDDYFMAEVEEDEADDDGWISTNTYRGKKRATKKVMKYCYEPEMEEIYRASMLRAFKKTLEEGMFSFIIVDDRNILVADFTQFWAIAKRSGYEVYVLEATYKDPVGCTARNVHDCTLEQIQTLADRWEPTPQLYLQLDVSSLFRGDELNAEEITEVEMDADDLERDMDDQEDAFAALDQERKSPLENGTEFLILSDKWKDSDLKQEKLKHKRKRTSPEVDASSTSSDSNEDASNALSGLMKAYGKKDKSVHWGDLKDGEEIERGFSIGAPPTKKRDLVIGPGSGYNVASNPLLDDDTEKGSELKSHESKDARKKWKLFEQLRDEQDAFKADFTRRRHRVRGLDEDEAVS